jgi:beta-mannosidase
VSGRAIVSLSLDGAAWRFRRAAKSSLEGRIAGIDEWMPAEVPGTVHTDLLRQGKIADPFFGTNERDQQWIERCGWEYEATFDVSDTLLSCRHVEIVFRGLDTFADVEVNGAPILRADNMFREWRADVKARLRPSDNLLAVRFRSPIDEAMGAYDALGYRLPAANDQAAVMVSMFARKAPYHYGWDWGPRFVTSGIWRSVSLLGWDGARLEDVHVVQTHLDDDRTDLRIKATVTAAGAVRAGVTVFVRGAAAGATERVLAAGSNGVDIDVTVDRPERWWPNGLGRPCLYEITVRLSVDGADIDERRLRIGLRSVEVVHREDRHGKCFTVHVNGAPTFMKGANYIPPDSFLPRVGGDRYRRLLQAAADANMNMLRVWGGGIYEDDRFYDLCDELGILVWQDFMFACSMYPSDEAFVENVRREATENVRRLRNHPCLALWAGNNEIEAAWLKWDWRRKFDLSDDAVRALESGYRRLFHEVLPGVVAAHDPSRFYTRSSPSANDDRVAPDTLGYGDMHYWGVWHAEAPYSEYAANVSRFMSEYGFQSFPEIDSVARYAPRSEWSIESPVMLAHQRHPRGNQLVRTYMNRDFRPPRDFASFLYVSQVLQATVIQFAAEAHRRRMPYNAGSLYWQLDDCWPVASWSGIDYYGRWKALHYFARRFFAPVLVSIVAEGGTIAVHVVSDRREAAPGSARLSLRLVDFGGRVAWSSDAEVRLPESASTLLATVDTAVFAAERLDRAVFVAEVFESEACLARGLHFFAKTKDLDLADPGVTVVVASRGERCATLEVSARTFAKSVRLSSGAAEGHFSDNYFDLLPGETVTVVWSGPPEADFEARSIRDTY